MRLTDVLGVAAASVTILVGVATLARMAHRSAREWIERIAEDIAEDLDKRDHDR